MSILVYIIIKLFASNAQQIYNDFLWIIIPLPQNEKKNIITFFFFFSVVRRV